jgi:PPOX class probable FMN-dependent enzyme
MPNVMSLDDLDARYPSAAPRVKAKKRDRLDDGIRAMLGVSPFVLLATSGEGGRCDVSPRGGPPGFVKPLDDRHVVVPDLNGNNLLDSFRNIVVNPHAALIVLVPGQDETLRIDGPAYLTDDDAVLDLFVGEVRRPVLAVVVETEAVFTHCAKSFRRGRVWDPTSWPVLDRSLALEARYRQLGLDESFEEYVAANEEKIVAGLCHDAPH